VLWRLQDRLHQVRETSPSRKPRDPQCSTDSNTARDSI